MITWKKAKPVVCEGMYCDIIYTFAMATSITYLKHTDIHCDVLVRDGSIARVDNYIQRLLCTYCVPKC